MKTLKFTSKKAQAFINAYMKSDYRDIHQVYQTYSLSKRIAQLDCVKTMDNEDGWGFRIISWNTFQFTCAWQLREGTLRVETRSNSYIIKNALPF